MIAVIYRQRLKGKTNLTVILFDTTYTIGETKPIKNGRVVATAKSLVADRMRDPEATRFKDEIYAYQTSYGDYIVCGTLNAKNAMGGYVGYKPFYVRIRNNAIESFVVPGEGDQYGKRVKRDGEGHPLTDSVPDPALILEAPAQIAL